MPPRCPPLGICARLTTALVFGWGVGLAGVAPPTPAGAAEANRWSAPANLPAGSVPTSNFPDGDLLLSTTGGQIMRYALQEEIPEIAFFEPDGTLGAPQRVTGSEPEGDNGPVAFLPGGTAVISLMPEASKPLGLTVRSADGAYGPLFAGDIDKPIKAFAAREGEVLAVRERTGSEGKPLIEAVTLAIEAGGKLTETGSPQVIYELPAEDTAVAFFRTVAVALGPDGSADVTMLAENEGRTSGGEVFAHNEVLDFHRAGPGDPWEGGGNLAAGLPYEATANELQVGVAPGGRAILAFKTSEPVAINSPLRSDSTHVYAALREPNGSFSSPVEVAAPQAPPAGSALATALVAAGADGTLALAYRTETCQTLTPEAAVETYGALVAPPGKSLQTLPLLGYSTADDTSRITALGAGHGQALVGMDDTEVKVGEGDNLCEYSPIPEDQTQRYDDRAVLVGTSEPLDGDEFTTKEETFGFGEVEVLNGSGGELFINSAAIDEDGDAAVTGGLGTPGGTEYAYFTGSGRRYGEATGENGENSENGENGENSEAGKQSGGGGTEGSQTGGGTQTGGGAKTPGGGAKTPGGETNHKGGGQSISSNVPLPKVGTLLVSATGRVTFTLTAPKLDGSSRLKVGAILTIIAEGRGSKGKAKTIARVTTIVRLASGKKTVIHLKLPAKGLAYLRAHHGHGAQLEIVASEPGHVKSTKAIVLKVKLAS